MDETGGHVMIKIRNTHYTISRSGCPGIESLPGVLAGLASGDEEVLRWYISNVTKDVFVVETTLVTGKGVLAAKGAAVEDLPVYPGKSVVINVVPTGVGCAIGGYAADAAPAAQLLASCCDYLITNPNTVNASNFIHMPDNVMYSEGYMIDLFSKGEVNLYRPYGNRVGLIVEKAPDKDLEVVFNIINTVRAVHGVNLEDVVITDAPIGGRCEQTGSGAYVGGIEHPGVLFKACEQLIERGVNAIAVTSNIKDLPMDNYAKHFSGEHPNPVGGAEAVISHLVCRSYGLPSAHAPMINVKEMDLSSGIVDARGAGEYASVSGLACVLIGLNRAPQFGLKPVFPVKDAVNVRNLTAVVAPAGTLGGIPMLYAARYGVPVLAVKENKTILDVTASALGLERVIPVNNYAEAAGIVQALRHGIAIPGLYRPLSTLRF
jgi:hypothetical protein